MVNWRGRRQSENVEDRRGEESAGGFQFPGGSGGGLPFPMPGGGKRGGGIGILGLLVILGIALLFGVNPLDILTGGGGGQFPMPRVDTSGRELPKFDIPDLPGTTGRKSATQAPSGGSTAAGDDAAAYVRVVLADTEDVWTRLFTTFGQHYRAPTLVLFNGSTPTDCGPGQSAMGPFYCPLDQKVYIDLQFYDDLKSRFGAPGDFAQAYVVAHEIGHHVQKLLGIADKVQAYKQRVSEVDGNALQVRMELQADCLAGVWANQADKMQGILEQGDVEEGLNAASAIGDDQIQKKTQGRVVPEGFTHGSSEQRVRWFKSGLQSGNIEVCDTFNADDL